ncbi:MAG: 1-acyl-sn-glycerol-3-phosphate acyltransferase [Hydrogenophaga sp.]|nr:1-acyl-sn-glycerol-3-phosphate acyltransferase [Hydrogenophaga sp.]
MARAALLLFGWRVLDDGFPTRQGVAIVYPHTSNWDFVVGLLAKWAIGIPVRFWAKDTLFEVPLFGRWLRWLGGMPIERRSPRGAVGAMVQAMRDAMARDDLLWLALSPEGTRRYVDGWRSGFYQVALGAGVPVAMVALDYGRKEVRVQPFLRLSGDSQSDYRAMAQALASAQGLRPPQASPIQPLPRA